jgi:hypothetical protein
MLLLLLLQVRAMYDAYRSPAVTLDTKQLLAWNMIMVRQRSCSDIMRQPITLITTSAVIVGLQCRWIAANTCSNRQDDFNCYAVYTSSCMKEWLYAGGQCVRDSMASCSTMQPKSVQLYSLVLTAAICSCF